MDIYLWVLVIGAGILGVLALFGYFKKRAFLPAVVQNNTASVQMQLQAYERLIILCERIGLKNLMTKFLMQGLTARQLQAMMIETIKNEFEYNVSQQIYVSEEGWRALVKYKDQNIYIIGQIGTMLPPNATAMDFSKHLIQFLSKEEKADLQQIVSQVLSFEAKKIMNP